MTTYVGFSYAKGVWGLLSRAVMFMTGDSSSHVWLVYYDRDFAAWMVMEASTTWRLIPFDEYCRSNQVVAVYRPALSIDAGLREGGRLLGYSYDVAGLLGNVIVRVGAWFKRRWRNPFRSSRAVFCSEGVLRVMRAAGFPGLEHLDEHEVTPGEIEHVLKTQGRRVTALQ